MQQIKIDTLKEGMIFSAPLFFDDGENMFLPKGHQLSAYHLSVLKRWKVPFILTSGHLVTSDEVEKQDSSSETFAELDEVEELDDADEVEELEELEDLSEAEEASDQKKKPEDYERVYHETVALLTDFFQKYKDKKPADRSLIDQISNSMVSAIENEPALSMAYVLNRGQSDSMASSAVNIAIISAAVAFHMQLPRQRVVMLVQAALLHDIGMLQIPEAIINKTNILTQQEFEQLKLHSLYSARFVTDVLMLPREVANIVLEHHERWDGSGYPNGGKATDIDLGARILAVADSFEALVGKKPYHDPIIGYEAMKTLLAESGTHFDSDVLKAFVDTMGVYPVGSIVQLSDSSVAKVIEANQDAPFQPVVQLQGEKDTIIRLQQQKALFIVRVVAPR